VQRRVYAVEARNFFVSSDAGATFKQFPLGANASLVTVSPDGIDVFVGTASGVVHTSDGGVSFAATGSGTLPAAAPTALGFAGSTVVAAFAGSGVFGSGDLGATWTLLQDPSVATALHFNSVTAIDGPDTATLLTATDGGPAVIRANGAAHWVTSNQGIELFTVTQLVVSSDGSLYAILDGQLFKSADAGETWTQAGNTLPGADSVAVQPDHPSVLAVIQGVDVFTSADTGATWTKTANLLGQLGLGSPTALSVGGDSPPAIYVTVQSRANFSILRSGDGGATFNLGTPGGTVIVSSVNPQVAYSVLKGLQTGATKTVDSGATFNPIFTNGSGVTALDIGATPDDIYILAPDGTVAHAFTGSGATFDVRSTGHSSPSDLRTSPFDSSRLMLVDGTGVSLSVDGGVTFKPASSGLPAATSVVPDPAHKGVWYGFAPGRGLFKTTTDGL